MYAFRYSIPIFIDVDVPYVRLSYTFMCSIHNHILLCIIDDFNFDYIKWNGGRKAILIRNISMFVGRFAY